MSITCPLSLNINEVCQTYEISKITNSASFSTLHFYIKLTHVETTQQADVCSKLLPKNCITIHKVIVVLSLFKPNYKDTRVTPIDVILVSLLITFDKLVSCFNLEFWRCIYLVWKFTYNSMFHYSNCCCISWRYIINTTNHLNKKIKP